MLADPRSQRFAEQFVQQWLNMELLEFINFREQVPGFDPLLKEAMQREPIALFEELLKGNESVLNFVHADYAMVNERLAKHYGMAGVSWQSLSSRAAGWELQTRRLADSSWFAGDELGLP